MREGKSGFVASAIQVERSSSIQSLPSFLERVESLVSEAVSRGSSLVVLPEFFAADYVSPEPLYKGDFQIFLGGLAAKYGCWLVGGSLSVIRDEGGNPYNTLVFYGPSGSILSYYHKRNLFYAHFSDGIVSEVDQFSPGSSMPVPYDTPFGSLGFAICYDLRFPELFISQKADIFVVPAAFRYQTGKDHWEVLLRARAIENQSFLVAANCSGRTDQAHFGGRSMIIDPWGRILSDCPAEGEFIVTSFVDMELLSSLRNKLPMNR
ncbi:MULTISPECIES: nitrilase-related carbon-nitrogen hydrolase [Candidatus Ichthyocystis]|uniref:Putative nitrilase n=1 Tax=Candidatus Ichthyocystis hellenicum TaxID=1561003 RepID=A0A0S4M3E3_9BURK|nr:MULTISPECIES: nitrilase-related carbon-nitrogen hydrolase [Ichthyocystis]CUT17519.1 putative nitrilase [Candidatus Ichthyocystis hellenicum]